MCCGVPAVQYGLGREGFYKEVSFVLGLANVCWFNDAVFALFPSASPGTNQLGLCGLLDFHHMATICDHIFILDGSMWIIRLVLYEC